ncbi:MAG: hypothetical protein LBM65_03600 [Oscillospiraceae bacterium]|jgi:hypothetical protein|nr:hypothetical protein [Oscillospiraceae bacterium]
MGKEQNEFRQKFQNYLNDLYHSNSIPKSEDKASQKNSYVDDKLFQYRFELAKNHYEGSIDRVIDISAEHLESQNVGKKELKDSFFRFFVKFVSIQYIVLVVLFALKILFDAFYWNFGISEILFQTYIISVFVETLSVIAVMVKFAFNNDNELGLISVLEKVVHYYKLP